MKWRNPKEELPKHDQAVYVMLKPHKWRGSMRESAASIQIVAGWYWSPLVENIDEYGFGSLGYILDPATKEDGHKDRAIAWVPAEEMPLPEFYKRGL